MNREQQATEAVTFAAGLLGDLRAELGDLTGALTIAERIALAGLAARVGDVLLHLEQHRRIVADLRADTVDEDSE